MENELSFYEKISDIQSRLKAPKGQYNEFGKYKYRSCEDILEALKPFLSTHSLFLNIKDDIITVGDRYYIKATVYISDGKEKVESAAFAREPLDKKGMDEAQITGSASSYARKYALNGLLCIDDTKDSDFENNGEQSPKCECCGRIFEEQIINGKKHSPQEVFSMVRKRYGKAICKNCREKE